MKSYLLIIIILLSVLTGCDEKHDARLVELDAALWRNPDSVLLVTADIDTTPLNAGDRAFLNLLRAEAADKSFQTDTSTATILALESYYLKGNREKGLHPRVNYILGRIHLERHEVPTALKYFRESARFSGSNPDARFMIPLHAQMSRIFSRSKLYRNSLEQAKRWFHFAKQDQDTLQMINASLWIATAYRNLNDKDSALFTYTSTAPLAKESGDSVFLTLYISQLADYMMDNEKYSEADSLIRSNKLIINDYTASSVESILNRLNMHFGNIKDVESRSLDILANSSDEYARKTAAANLTRINIDRGNPIAAIEYADTVYKLLELIGETEASKTIAEIENLYSFSETERRKRELENENLRLTYHRLILGIILGVVIISVGIIGTLTYRWWKRKWSDSIREKKKMKKKLSKQGSKIKRLNYKKKNVENILKEKTIAITQLHDEIREKEKITAKLIHDIYVVTKDRDSKTKFISDAIIRTDCDELAIKLRDPMINEIERIETLNKLGLLMQEKYPEFYKSIRDLNLHQNEFVDAMLIKIGLTVGECARVIGTDYKTLNTRRYRLGIRINVKEKGFSSWLDFIKRIDGE